jgi:hypothetical protein
MAKIKTYGQRKIEEAAKKMIEEGAEIMPTDKNEAFFVSTNTNLIIPLGHLEVDGIDIFVGPKK